MQLWDQRTERAEYEASIPVWETVRKECAKKVEEALEQGKATIKPCPWK